MMGGVQTANDICEYRQKMAKQQKGEGTHTQEQIKDIIIFSDGTYTGDWRRGKRHGQGTMAYNKRDRSMRHAGGCAGG